MCSASLLRHCVTATTVRSSVASSSRLFSNTAASSRVGSSANRTEAHPPTKPTEFLTTIATPSRGDLSSISNLLGEEASWDTMYALDRYKLKKAGVPVKERRYATIASEE
ncbi:hypothetical protein CBS101457_006248 [Exobasidium rhododendri]|nr:hypothetical protein CBS101457_006248 [Exobasidium rhododendri]